MSRSGRNGVGYGGSQQAAPMTQAIAPEAPVAIEANTFDFEKAYNDLEAAYMQLIEFWPREKSPFTPKQRKDACRLIEKCVQITGDFYDMTEEEVVL